jgi:hypothetical protein
MVAIKQKQSSDDDSSKDKNRHSNLEGELMCLIYLSCPLKLRIKIMFVGLWKTLS